MIERLFNNEALGKNPAYKVLTHAMTETADRLMNELDPEQKFMLLTLTDLYAQLEGCVALASFKDGFSTAVLLALDIMQGQNQMT